MIHYSKQTIWIPIGKSIFTGKPALFPMRYYGTNLLLSLARVGKTATGMELVVKISKVRKVIVFDYNGEWKGCVTNYNYESKSPEHMENVKVYDNFTFRLTDFTDFNDFIALGFSPEGIRILPSLFACKNIHDNDPELLMDVLEELPTTSGELDDWNKKYGNDIHLPAKLIPVARDSMCNKFYAIKHWFWHPKDQRTIFNIMDFFRYDHLIIDLSDLGIKGTDSNRAMAFAGLILKKLTPLITRTLPFIVVEEAGKICPNFGDNPGFVLPSSVQQFILYSTSLPKLGVATLFLAQSSNQLPNEITNHYHTKIMSILPEDANPTDRERTAGLQWNPDFPKPYGYREFIIWERQGKWDKFVPFTPPCCQFKQRFKKQ